MARRKMDRKREINGIIYLMCALIMAAAYYLAAGTTGWVGAVLRSAGYGLFGVAALALPAIFASMALDYFIEKRVKYTRQRFVHVLLALLGAAALLHAITIDPVLFNSLTTGESGRQEAFMALELLWASGIRPQLVSDLTAGSNVLTGGLLGGGAATGLMAIAGKTGALILIGALLLSQLVLFLNVSLSTAVGRTATALVKTSRKVDDAVRAGVASIRETHLNEEKHARNYDIDLTKKQAAEAGPGSDESNKSSNEASRKKYSLLETLKKLWQDEEPLPKLPPEELAVPGFLQSGEPAGAAPPVADAKKGIRQTSPFDLIIPDQSQSSDQIFSDNQPLKNLPAGIHRVGAKPEPAVNTGASHDDHFNEKGRSHWQDRTDPGAAVVYFPSDRKTAGAQLAIDLPYQPPKTDLLHEDNNPVSRRANSAAIQALGHKLEHTLDSFGIQAKVVHVTTGPTITRFELSPGPGVKVSRIVSLSDDIALNLAAMGVRIEAPIPGKSAIGIEIPNKETSPVLLRGLLESPEFSQSSSPLTAALGRDIQGNPILCDLAKMPHLLIAGATGSGKSVCINAILMSILFRSSPDDVRMMMIDPKVVELSVYNGIPHLLSPVVTDPKKAANTLNWAVNEMVRRYGLFADKAVRDINSYNAAAAVAIDRGDDEYEKLPLILFVIDELSDLMATTPTEVEDAIARLTAMARAAGIHLIIATQRPSVDVITGVIKANIPSRIAFAVASQVDSRTILDMGGAEKLLGKGDMLYYPQSSAKPIRGQGAFVTDTEVERVLSWLKARHAPEYDQEVTHAIMTAVSNGSRDRDSGDEDELVPQALEIVVETGYASVSLLQRRMKLGYPRAARLIDALHDKGFIGPFDGSKPRKVLISQAQYLEFKARGDS